MFCADKGMHTCADGQDICMRVHGVDDLSCIETQAVEVECAAEETVDDEGVAGTVHMKINVIGADGNFNGGRSGQVYNLRDQANGGLNAIASHFTFEEVTIAHELSHKARI